MDRHRLLVLTASVIALAGVPGCGEWQDLPVHLYFDTDFNDVEYQAGLDVVAEWNEWAGGRYAYGDEVFVVAGRFDDDFNVNDYEDQYHVVYRINGPGNPDVEYLQTLYADSGGVGGYNTLSDGFIVMYPVDAVLLGEWQDLQPRIEAGEINADGVREYLDERRYGIAHNYMLHEFGHMLGLIHQNSRQAVMNSNGSITYDGIEYLTDADLDAFCENYDCCCDCND